MVSSQNQNISHAGAHLLVWFWIFVAVTVGIAKKASQKILVSVQQSLKGRVATNMSVKTKISSKHGPLVAGSLALMLCWFYFEMAFFSLVVMGVGVPVLIFGRTISAAKRLKLAGRQLALRNSVMPASLDVDSKSIADVVENSRGKLSRSSTRRLFDTISTTTAETEKKTGVSLAFLRAFAREYH